MHRSTIDSAETRATDGRHPGRPRRCAVTLFVITASALAAVGCGGSSSEAPKLGLSEKTLCTVGKAKIASADVRSLAGGMKDVLGKAEGTPDVDDLQIEDYEGTLEPLELLAADTLIARALVERAATKAEVEVDADDVEDELDDLAEQIGIDTDDLVERLTDGTGLSETQLRDSLGANLLVDEVVEELDADERDRYDPASEYADEVLRPAAEEAGTVTCATGVKWDGGIDYTLEDEDGEDVDLDTVTDEVFQSAVGAPSTTDDTEPTTGTTEEPAPAPAEPSPLELAAEYDARASRMVGSLGNVVLRAGRATDKFTSGKISVKSTTDAFARHARLARQVQRASKSYHPADDYIAGVHPKLTQAAGEVAQAMEMMSKLGSAGSSSELDRRFKEVQKHLDKGDKLLEQWGGGLDADPQSRSFPKIIASLKRINSQG